MRCGLLGTLGQLIAGLDDLAFLHEHPRRSGRFIFALVAHFVHDGQWLVLPDDHAARVLGGGFFLATLGDQVARVHFIAVLDLDGPVAGNIVLVFDELAIHDFDQAHAALRAADFHNAVNIRHDGFALGLLARLEQFFHARQTVRDVARAGHAAGVEGAQRELRARLADGLRRPRCRPPSRSQPSRRGPGRAHSTSRTCHSATGTSSPCGRTLLRRPTCQSLRPGLR